MSNANVREVKLEDLGGGKPAALLAQGLAEVLDNIANPNTVAQAKRKITLHFDIQPSEERAVGKVDIYVQTRLAKVKTQCAVIHFATDGTTIKAFEFDTNQPMIPGMEKGIEPPNITPIKKEA